MRILLSLVAALVLCGLAQDAALAQPTVTLWPDRFDPESIPVAGGAQAIMEPCERPRYTVTAGALLVVDTDSLNAFRQNTLTSDATTAGGTVRLSGDTLYYRATTGLDRVSDVIRIRSCFDAAGTNCEERTVTVRIGRPGAKAVRTVPIEGGQRSTQGLLSPAGSLFCGSVTPFGNYEYARYREARFSEYAPGDSLLYRSARGGGNDAFEVVLCNTFGTCDTTELTFRVVGRRTTLPFFDDFSYAGPEPDADLWLEDVVYVNDAYGLRNPSYGVATFDGVDGGGRNYGEGIQDIDQLTSVPVDLTAVAGANRLFVKYYLQTGGRGLAPEAEDKFITQFRRDDGEWVTQRTVVGSRISRADSVFEYHALPIAGSEFRHRDFQVRFLMRANAAGSNDSWNLDYVRIEQAEDTSRAFRDIALASRPPSPLAPYSRVPYTQFTGRPTLLRERLPVELWNHFAIQNNVSRSSVVVEDSFGIELLSAGLLTGAQFNLPPGFSRINNPIPAEPLATYKRLASGLNARSVGELRLVYQLGIDQDQSRITGVRRNDTATTTINIRDEYAYDDGTAELGLVNGRQGDRIAVRYEAFVGDTLKGLRFAFPNLSVADADRQLINLEVYIGPLVTSSNPNDPPRRPDYVQELARPFFPSVYGDTTQALTSYRFEDRDGKPTPIYIPPGEFYVGWQQSSDVSRPIQVGVDLNNDNAGAIFTEFGDGWKALPTVLTRFRGSLIIRPVFGQIRTSSGVEEAGVNRFAVYPNPTRGQVNLRIEDAAREPARYQVFDATGRIVAQGAYASQLELGLVAGVYTLRLLDRGGLVYGRERIVVQ